MEDRKFMDTAAGDGIGCFLAGLGCATVILALGAACAGIVWALRAEVLR